VLGRCGTASCWWCKGCQWGLHKNYSGNPVRWINNGVLWMQGEGEGIILQPSTHLRWDQVSLFDTMQPDKFNTMQSWACALGLWKPATIWDSQRPRVSIINENRLTRILLTFLNHHLAWCTAHFHAHSTMHC
jgi:hypothetical protein